MWVRKVNRGPLGVLKVHTGKIDNCWKQAKAFLPSNMLTKKGKNKDVMLWLRWWQWRYENKANFGPSFGHIISDLQEVPNPLFHCFLQWICNTSEVGVRKRTRGFRSAGMFLGCIYASSKQFNHLPSTGPPELLLHSLNFWIGIGSDGRMPTASTAPCLGTTITPWISNTYNSQIHINPILQKHPVNPSKRLKVSNIYQNCLMSFKALLYPERPVLGFPGLG